MKIDFEFNHTARLIKEKILGRNEIPIFSIINYDDSFIIPENQEIFFKNPMIEFCINDSEILYEPEIKILKPTTQAIILKKFNLDIVAILKKDGDVKKFKISKAILERNGRRKIGVPRNTLLLVDKANSRIKLDGPKTEKNWIDIRHTE